MNQADDLLTDSVSRMLTDLCGPGTVSAAESGEWPAPLWNALQEAGLTLAWIPEELGGAGASLADGFAIARIAAGFAAPVPLAETLLAGWLLSRGGLAAPTGPLTVATPAAEGIVLGIDGTLRGRAARVPFASEAHHLALAARRGGEEVIALVDVASCALRPSTSLAGEPLDEVVFEGAAPVALAGAPTPGVGSELDAMGAALRAQQMAGALERVLDLSLAYAREREQFGRPIARFQAVQHNLAVLAAEVAAAGASANAAVSSIDRHGIGDARTLLAVASAKVRAGEAAGAGAAIAHQVHGAMGFTREYRLHHYTRRLWAWRDEFGPESVWAARIGELVAANGPDALWPTLTAI